MITLARLTISEALQAAAANFQAGRSDNAQEILSGILQVQPQESQAHQLLGFIAFQKGSLSEAVFHLQTASACSPYDPEIKNNLGNFYKAAGELDLASDCYRQVMELDPSCFSAYYNLAAVHVQSGHLAQAEQLYLKSIEVQNDVAEAHYNLAIVLKQMGRTAESIERYRQCVALDPNFVQGHVNLGGAYWQEGLTELSLQSYKRALELDDNSAEIHNNLGVAQTATGAYGQAVQSFQCALALDSGFTDALANLGIVQRLMGKTKDSLESLSLIIAQYPEQPGPIAQLANTLAEVGEFKQAIDTYRQALALDPTSYETLVDFGICLANSGDTQAAAEIFAEAGHLQPQSFAAKWGKLMAELPAFYADSQEIDIARQRYSAGLTAIEKELRLDDPRFAKQAAEAIGYLQPHFLTYQGQNDRDLNTRYGNLLVEIMSHAYPEDAVKPGMPKLASGERIRVGIVSRHFNNHSDFRVLIAGWLAQFDHQQFEVLGYSTGKVADQETESARKLCDVFVENLGFEQLRKRIKSDKPHVLIYPELGQDSISMRLACLNLAALQCVAWGRKETSGLPTIDYFLGSDLMEPEKADQHYSEKLVRLPNLGTYYVPKNLKAEPWALEKYGVRKQAVVYLCAQSLFKYLPQYDQILPRIAAQIDNAQFVFVSRGQELEDKLKKRLASAFASAGLNSDQQVIFLPALAYEEFLGLCQRACVFLDTPDYSDSVTVFDALEQSLPVVTIKGALMRARQAAAIMERMGVRDTIASDLDNYVELCCALGKDAEFRQAVADKIDRRRYLLYHDSESPAALMNFIKQEVDNRS